MNLPLLDLVDGHLRCPGCHGDVATLTEVRESGHLDDPDSTIFVPIAEVVDGELRASTQPINFDGPTIGAVVVLAPGFVNARSPHPGGPWFIPGNAGPGRPRVTLPVVITCRCGATAQRPKLWLDPASAARATGVADLLYYYAMLNFAKAELLQVQPNAVQGFIGHGLHFNGFGAKSVLGDYLTVRDGVFRLLYEERTGYPLPAGTRLPVKRLLRNIPEIGEQIEALNAGLSGSAGVIQLVASDPSEAWVILAVTPDAELDNADATGRYFRAAFRRVDAPPQWRDRFGVSRRWMGMDFYEARTAFAFASGDDKARFHAGEQAADNTWKVKDVLGATTSSMWDARISPSMYKSRMLPMPPSLARYAMAFYASSLVRYRPALFDLQVFPEQAYLFDSIARECALPMLIDTLAALTGRDLIFLAEDAMRV